MILQTKNKPVQKKEVYRPDMIYFDTTIKYSIPLIKEGLNRYIDNEEIVSGVSIEQDKKNGYVKTTKEGYQSKWFMDQYFDWLLYTGYIKKEEDVEDE